jgi:hypothetical protein
MVGTISDISLCRARPRKSSISGNQSGAIRLIDLAEKLR